MRRSVGVVLAAVMTAFTAIRIGAYEAGFRWNASSSMPIGLWRVSRPPERFERGMVVLFCMSDSPLALMALERSYVAPGRCLSHTEPLLKVVGAVSGDMIETGATGIFVNGTPQPSSAPLARDPAGRLLPAIPAGEYSIARDELWLLSGYSALSFDSRYFGPVNISDVQGIARPILTWDGQKKRRPKPPLHE